MRTCDSLRTCVTSQPRFTRPSAGRSAQERKARISMRTRISNSHRWCTAAGKLEHPQQPAGHRQRLAGSLKRTGNGAHKGCHDGHGDVRDERQQAALLHIQACRGGATQGQVGQRCKEARPAAWTAQGGYFRCRKLRPTPSPGSGQGQLKLWHPFRATLPPPQPLAPPQSQLHMLAGPSFASQLTQRHFKV